MKKIKFLLPAALAFVFAVVAAFASYANKGADSYLVNVRYENGSACSTCTLVDPGTGFACSTTQNINDPRCTCTVSTSTFNATDASDTSVPCAPLWRNSI